MKKLVLATMVILLLASSSYAASYLVWDANDDAEYYIVSYGEKSKTYTEHSEKLTVCELPIGDIDFKYKYFAIKAYNSFGNSSSYSKEVVIFICPQNVRVEERETFDDIISDQE